MDERPVFPVKEIVIVCIVYTLCLIAVLVAVNKMERERLKVEGGERLKVEGGR